MLPTLEKAILLEKLDYAQLQFTPFDLGHFGLPLTELLRQFWLHEFVLFSKCSEPSDY